jgi:hypothetical protein
MSDLLARATHRLLKLRDDLVQNGPDLPKKSAALLKREISLAEMHVRVLRRLRTPAASRFRTRCGHARFLDLPLLSKPLK